MLHVIKHCKMGLPHYRSNCSRPKAHMEEHLITVFSNEEMLSCLADFVQGPCIKQPTVAPTLKLELEETMQKITNSVESIEHCFQELVVGNASKKAQAVQRWVMSLMPETSQDLDQQCLITITSISHRHFLEDSGQPFDSQLCGIYGLLGTKRQFKEKESHSQ